MKPFKTAALSLIAVFVCLALLLVPDSQQSEPPVVKTLPLETDSSTLIAPPKPVHIEPQHSQVAATDRNLPVEADKNIESAGTTSNSQLDNWPLMLYPELARIVELENLPADTALAELVPMLSNAGPVVRLAIFESLMDMNHPALLPTLSAALDDVDSQVRILALQALGTLDEPMAVSSIEPYLHARETDVRLAAIEALSNLENEQAVRTLAGLLSDQDAKIRHHAVNALGEIGGEQAIAFLRQARFDPDADIRANAITILDELGETAW